MGHKKQEENVTLEALLRLKRNERPSEDFWNSFDNDFERRRLNALVERDSGGHFFGAPILKAAMLGLPALLVVSLTVLWFQDGSHVSDPHPFTDTQDAPAMAVRVPEPEKVVDQSVKPEREWMPRDNERLLSQFVVDAITSEPEHSMNFRKVLYTPALHLSGPTGASYVRDSLSSRNYKVTTADVKLGRNF